MSESCAHTNQGVVILRGMIHFTSLRVDTLSLSLPPHHHGTECLLENVFEIQLI